MTLRTTAAAVPIPKTTFATRIRELGIEPDAITIEVGDRPSVLLFDSARLPDIRRQLLNLEPPIV
jgi:hypothetical protein